MYAVIEHGGKQYIVRPGEIVRLEKIDGEKGDKVTFDDVLLWRDDEGNVDIQAHDHKPNVVVIGEIVDTVREKKVIVFKKKRKSTYKKKQGHRQWKTLVRILEIKETTT